MSVMRPVFALVAGLLLLGLGACSGTASRGDVMDAGGLRERAAQRDAWLIERLDQIVPELMRDADIDCWLLIAREDNEDPVLETMLPATWMGARRRTILAFFDPGDGAQVERLAVARYAVGDAFPGAWDPESQPDQYARLAELVAERQPERIGINTSVTFAKADGLAASEHRALLSALGSWAERVVPAEALAVGWLETRSEAELDAYPGLVAIAHDIIATGLSNAAITPGETTTTDLEWWFREEIRARRLVTWFHPSVSVQRGAQPEREGGFAEHPDVEVIGPGDLVHVDFGITALGLNTDTQQHAYVLRPGESGAPAGLEDGLAVGNRLQDILTDAFVTGRTGNEILAAALQRARDEGIDALIYTHPLGFHGHGAGPTIGMWDQQGGVPGTGDWPLRANTCYAIELGATVSVPEWGRSVDIMLEEDALFDGERVRYLDGRQTELHLIR